MSYNLYIFVVCFFIFGCDCDCDNACTPSSANSVFNGYMQIQGKINDKVYQNCSEIPTEIYFNEGDEIQYTCYIEREDKDKTALEMYHEKGGVKSFYEYNATTKYVEMRMKLYKFDNNSNIICDYRLQHPQKITIAMYLKEESPTNLHERIIYKSKGERFAMNCSGKSDRLLAVSPKTNAVSYKNFEFNITEETFDMTFFCSNSSTYITNTGCIGSERIISDFTKIIREPPNEACNSTIADSITAPVSGVKITTTLIGASLGGVLLVIGILILIICVCKHRKKLPEPRDSSRGTTVDQQDEPVYVCMRWLKLSFRVSSIDVKLPACRYFTGYITESLYHRTTRRTETRHPFMVDVPPARTKRFASTFIMRTAKEWNTLPASSVPDSCNLGVFKYRVNRYLLGKHDPSSTASSLSIR